MRVSFGTGLIASIVIVCTTIIVVIACGSSRRRGGSSSSSRRSGSSYRRGGSSSSSSSFDLEDLFRSRRGEGGMGFIESVFSFVFGDGDPNPGIEEERWKLIGQYIASTGGVVASEELVPYLDIDDKDKDDDDDDSSYILPVLLQFDGHPELDDEGNILYHFPSLQRTARGQKLTGQVVQRRLFKEKRWEFSKASILERAMVIGLGGVNLFGVIILNRVLKNIELTRLSPRVFAFVSFVSMIFPLLKIYAASFFAIPLIRWFFILCKNAKIDKRNQAREVRAKSIESLDLSLRRKLLSAGDMARRTFIGKDKIVYSTDKDLIEQDYGGVWQGQLFGQKVLIWYK